MYGSKMCPRLGIGGERARDTILCGGKDKKKMRVFCGEQIVG